MNVIVIANNKTSNIDRSRRISKMNRKNLVSRSILFKPIDDIIGQCVAIHKTLQRSYQILNDFNREIRSITEYFDQVHAQECHDDLTVWNLDTECTNIVNHRNMFDRFEDNQNCSDLECTEEQFKREIVSLNKKRCVGSSIEFSMDKLNFDAIAFLNNVPSRSDAEFLVSKTDS